MIGAKNGLFLIQSLRKCIVCHVGSLGDNQGGPLGFLAFQPNMSSPSGFRIKQMTTAGLVMYYKEF